MTTTSRVDSDDCEIAEEIRLWFVGRKIQKVPLLLRNEERNRGAYDPKVVSFGPYHHGKPELQLCEQGKHIAVQIFLEGSNQSREFFYAKILEVIAGLKDCYIEASTDNYSDDEFAEMMLLDACFLIYCLGIGEHDTEIHRLMYNHLGGLALSLIYHDIVLLENQIPFHIVMLLISLRYGEQEVSVSKFLHEFIWGDKYTPQCILITQVGLMQNKPLHLLDALHRILVWDYTPEQQVQIETNEDIQFKSYHRTFRSAKDLISKGIHFRSSGNKSLQDINFSSFTFYGELQLPTWFVSSITKVFFLNMIAYELSPNNVVDTTVTTYITVMKSLLESQDDVKELREKRILVTSLSTDDEVVGVFRDLHTYGMANTKSFRLVQRRIKKHYDSKRKTWMAELIHTYLSSPWSIIGWVVGLLLVILTIVQTHFTINPKK